MSTGGMYAISGPIWGQLTDRKWIQLKTAHGLGALLLMISFFFMGPVPFLGFNPNYPVIIICLNLHGIGYAAMMVAGFSDIHRSAIRLGFPENLATYGMATSIWTSTFALGAFSGPIVGGALIQNIGFQWACLFLVGMNVIVFLAAFAYLCIDILKKKQVKVLRNQLNEALNANENAERNADADNSNSNAASDYGSFSSRQTSSMENLIASSSNDEREWRVRRISSSNIPVVKSNNRVPKSNHHVPISG